MTLTRSKLRLLVERALLEGFKDDQRYLAEKHPDHAQDLESLPPKWIGWLTARFGERSKTEEIHPFEDAIVTIKNFSKRDAGLSAKYAAPGTEERPNVFKASVDEAFPPEDRSWKSPADATTMTVDEMEEILGLSERKKERFKSDVSEEEMESDRVGKVGPWNLWIPTTRERSCKIAGYDPVTRQPKTTWCTARMAGSNLFYSYTGRPGTDMTLFYIIRDNPKQDRDWLSLGFINGEPVLDGKHGGISVDRANDGLTPQKLKAVLGQHLDEIMRILTEKNKSLGGQHPARQKIKDAARSAAALRYLTQGLSKTEAADLKMHVAGEPEIEPEVLQILARDENEGIRTFIATRRSTPAEILQQLARDKDLKVRSAVAMNLSAPAEILQTLAGDEDPKIRVVVAANRSVPTEVLQTLARDTDPRIRSVVAGNRSAPAEVLQTLALQVGKKNKNVRSAVAWNPSAPAEVLQTLAGDEESDIRYAVATSPNTSAKVLQTLAGDKEWGVRFAVARNKISPAEVLQTLTHDELEKIRDYANYQLRSQGLNEARLHQLIRQML